MGHQIKRTVWLVGRLLLIALAADLLRPVATLAIPPVVESFLSLSDVTTANSSPLKHGFLKKLDGNSAHCMGGDGNWNACGGATASGLVLLEEHTASSSATMDFTTRNAAGQSGNTFQSDYDEYQVEMTGIFPATNGSVIRLRFSTDSGGTWDTGSNYAFGGRGTSSSGGAEGGAQSTTFIGFQCSTSLGVNTGVTAQGSLLSSFKFSLPGGSLFPRAVGLTSYIFDTGFPSEQCFWGGVYLSTTAPNAMRLDTTSGNINGTARVYGLAK